MRILHVSPSYLPAIRYGGPIYSVHGLCRAQIARGCDVHVFTTNVDGAGVSPMPLGEPVDLDGVKIWYFPCGWGRRLYRSPAMASALERLLGDFDIVHAHSAFLWPTSASFKAARIRRKPFVFSPRGMLLPEPVRAKSWLAKRLWTSVIGRELVSQAAAVHVTSKAEREGLQKLGLRARRFGVVPNGVDPPPPTSRRESQRPFVLSLGRISWKKGLDRLIEAFAHVPDAELVIAGNDDEGLTPHLRAAAARLGLTGRVRFVGAVAGAEKWELMHGAAVFALASHSENFANAVLEAMACGAPVVVTPEVGLAEEVSSIPCGIVAEGDPAIFGAAIASLLADPEKRARLGAAGRRAAEERFSWGAVATQMDELYQSARES